MSLLSQTVFIFIYDAAHNHNGHVKLMVGHYWVSVGNRKSKCILVHLCSLIINFLSLHCLVGKFYGFMIRKVQV